MTVTVLGPSTTMSSKWRCRALVGDIIIYKKDKTSACKNHLFCLESVLLICRNAFFFLVEKCPEKKTFSRL
jgi:hypothetical protein